MPQNFIECDREQLLLMSPSLREWLPENHLAWFVIDAVKDVDLSAFYARYRQDGWGRAAYDPAMMVAIVVDGTKVHANASRDANADFDQIAREILKEAAEVDAAEDELYGEKRGDELPEHLSTSQGRRGWLREAKRQLDEERAKEAKPIPRSRPARLKEAKRRLQEELWVESRANAA